MDPLLAIIVIFIVGLAVWLLNLPGLVLGATVVICLIALLLPYVRGGIR